MLPSSITAWFVMMPKFRATAAPTPTLVLPVSLPSALAVPPVCAALLTVTRPPLATVTPDPMEADVVDTPTFTPTAAATLTLPSLVLAEGAGLPEPSAALAADASAPSPLAVLPCAATCWSTVCPELELPSALAGAPPATLAVALVALLEVELALTLTDPPAARSRFTDAATVSVAAVSARDAPTATLLPWVVPLAVVLTLAVWLAVLE